MTDFEIIGLAEIELKYASYAKAPGFIQDRVRNDPKFPTPWRHYGAPIHLWAWRADEVAKYFAALSDRGHAKRAARRATRLQPAIAASGKAKLG